MENPTRHKAVVTIANTRGMHARAAARFVKIAQGFSANIEVERNDISVSGRSIMGLMMLAAGQGTRITIRANGQDAPQAIEHLVNLVERRFDEA
ncbi:MAG TPA: HPr family phosphocarrier protein [Rhodospirillaceae bacterium]|nr:MAG: hypothetical protein A2018_01710 [Alphaproteobacteria bacterium GWF2_58_20]HAU28560.1 HPr family phosphocarrier protein [Rhodospirillaceae bacterium]